MTISLIFAGLGIAFGALSVVLSVRKSRRSDAASAEGISSSTEVDR